MAVKRTLLTQFACTFGAGMPPTGGSWSCPPFRGIVTMCRFVLAVDFRAANCATISRHVPVIARRRQFRGTRCPRCRSTQVRMPASIRSHDQSIRPSVRLPSRMPISNIWPSRHPEPMDPPRAPRLPAELFGRARPIGKGEIVLENLLETAVGVWPRRVRAGHQRWSIVSAQRPTPWNE